MTKKCNHGSGWRVAGVCTYRDDNFNMCGGQSLEAIATIKTVNTATPHQQAQSIVDNWHPERPYPNDLDYQQLVSSIAHAIEAAGYFVKEQS